MPNFWLVTAKLNIHIIILGGVFVLLNMARAEIKGGKKYPRIRGIVTFRQTGKGVLITAKIYNLPATIGKCNKRMYAR